MGMIIPIISMPILTRAIGAEQYGQYILFLSILIFGHTFIDYGIQYIGVRDIAKRRYSDISVKYIYEKYQGVRFLFLFLYSISIIVYSIFFLDSLFIQYIFIYGIPYLLGYFLTSAWFFQGIGKTKFLLITTLISKIINLIVIILFVNNEEDTYLVLASTTWSVLLTGLLLYLMTRSRFKTNLFSLRKLFPTIKKGKDVFIGILAPNFYNSIPIIILGTISSPVDFAKFAVANRLCSIIVTFQNVISKSVYPILTIQKKSHANKLAIINSLISIPIVIFIILWGNEAISLFLGKDFSDSNQYLIIFSIGIIMLGISNSYGEGFLLPHGYDKKYRNVSLIVSILSSIISYILIYYFGLLGGALALTIARALFSFGFYISYLGVKNAHN